MKQTLSILFCLLTFTLFAQDEQTIDEHERQYGLAQFWKGAAINFAFFEQVPELNWDSVYFSYIPKVAEAKNDYEYVRLLQEMCGLLKDGHTRVYLPRHLQMKRHRPAIATTLIEDGVFITHVLNDTIADMGIEKGMQILQIDGIEVHEYAQKNVQPYCFASTPQDMEIQVYSYELLWGWMDQPVKLQLKTKAGEIVSHTLPRDLIRNFPGRPVMEFEVLENGIGHLSIYRFWGDDFFEAFDEIYPKLADTKGLIIDIRINQGGNSGNAIYVLQHLSNKSFYTSNWSTPVYNAAYKSWGREDQWYEEKGELVEPETEIAPYNKPVITLIGPRTYSAAEDFCSYYQQAAIGPMMGSPTAGSTGNPIGVQLGENLWSQVCTKKDVFYDGTEFVGYGVQPDITSEQSTEDFWAEKDSVLEDAVEYLKKKMK